MGWSSLVAQRVAPGKPGHNACHELTNGQGSGAADVQPLVTLVPRYRPNQNRLYNGKKRARHQHHDHRGPCTHAIALLRQQSEQVMLRTDRIRTSFAKLVLAARHTLIAAKAIFRG